jgi:hypothetical protein
VSAQTRLAEALAKSQKIGIFDCFAGDIKIELEQAAEDVLAEAQASAKHAPIPDGWALVPRTPLPSMLVAVGAMNGYAGAHGEADVDHIEWYEAIVEEAQNHLPARDELPAPMPPTTWDMPLTREQREVEDAFRRGWNSYRAALMLAAAPQPHGGSNA